MSDDHWATDEQGGLVVEDDCALFWDQVEFHERFGEYPFERAGEDEVCCRECGEAVGGSRQALAAHLSAGHGIALDVYAERNPAAPVEAPEPEPSGAL